MTDKSFIRLLAFAAILIFSIGAGLEEHSLATSAIIFGMGIGVIAFGIHEKIL